MSDTPKTDEQLNVIHWNTYCLKEREGTDYVPAEFARKLEREAKLNCTLLEQEIDLVELLIRERDALKEELKQKQQPTLI